MEDIKFVKVVFIILFGLFFTQAHAALVDISDIEVSYGDPVTLSVTENQNIDAGFTIALSFAVEHVPSSWLVDTKITIRNSYWGIDFDISGKDCGFSSGKSGIGSCDLELFIYHDSWVGDIWTLTFEDTFVGSEKKEYSFLENSYIAWGCELDLIKNNSTVPEPAMISLILLGSIVLLVNRRKNRL